MTPAVPQALGRIGRVLKVFGDGNLQVTVGGQLWTFSPSCLVAYRPQEDANLDVAERARENKSAGRSLCVKGGVGGCTRMPFNPHLLLPPGSLGVALEKLRAQKSDTERPGRLVVEAALGDMARALDMLRRHPEQAGWAWGTWLPPSPPAPSPFIPAPAEVTRGKVLIWASSQVDTKNQGRTALQVAAYLGQLELVRLLLQARAGVDVRDEEGHTALHYAALG